MLTLIKQLMTVPLLTMASALSLRSAYAAPVVEKIHFLLPAGAGAGGGDGMARGTGEALTKSARLGSVSYENRVGGGGKAIAHLIAAAPPDSNVLMVNSMLLVIRSFAECLCAEFSRFNPHWRDYR